MLSDKATDPLELLGRVEMQHTYDDVLGNTASCLVKCSFSREILKERMEETRSSSEVEEQVATLLEQNAELKRLLVESATTGSNILAHNKELKQHLLQLQTDYAEKQEVSIAQFRESVLSAISILDIAAGQLHS